VNGWLAGWVASEVYAGRGLRAWKTFLIEHEQRKLTGFECAIETKNRCPEDKRIPLSLAQSLERDLRELELWTKLNSE